MSREKHRRICGACGRTHFAGGVCSAPKPALEFPPETPAKAVVDRAQLWAVIDAAKAFLAKSQEGRVGSPFYQKASERLELELGRLPENVWTR